MTHVVIYTRFSPRRDAEEAVSCETQLAQCRELIVKNGWVERFAAKDEAVSGSTDLEHRDGLMAAIAELRRGDVFLVYHPDRIARDALLSELARRMVAGKGARIEAVTGNAVRGDDDSPEAKFIRGVLDLVWQLIREQIAAKTKSAMLSQQRSGRRMSRIPPYGKQPDPADPTRWIDHPAEQRAVVRAKQLRGEGLGSRAIATRLSKEMPELARGKAWSPRTVMKIVGR